MFLKVVDGVPQSEISVISKPDFYPIEGWNPDEIKFDNISNAVFTGEKVIVIPIARSLESAKAFARAKLYEMAKNMQDKVFSAYSNAEVVTFPEKKRQAELLQETGNSADAPMLVAIANRIVENSGGEFADALEELKNSILAKVGFEELMFRMEAVRKAKAIKIGNFGSIEELADFYYSAEWKQGFPQS